MDGDWNQAGRAPPAAEPAGVAREIAAGEQRAAAARQRAGSFYDAVAEATAGNSPPTAKPSRDKETAFVFDPILASPQVSLEAFMEGGSARKAVSAAIPSDLDNLAALAATALAEATERMEEVDREIETHRKARRDLEVEATQSEAQLSSLSILGTRALLDGDKGKRETISLQRSRLEASAREARANLAFLDKRLETLRVDRLRCAERVDLWRGTVEDISVVAVMPGVAETLQSLATLLAPLEPSRRLTLQGHLAALVTGRFGNELHDHLMRLGTMARKRVQPPAAPAERVFAPADTIVELRRRVSFVDGPNSTKELPAGFTGPVPAHVADRIVKLEAGRLLELPGRVEIKALTELTVEAGGVLPRGHTAMLPRAEALELVRHRKAEFTGGHEATTPISIVKLPVLELGYVEPPAGAGAQAKEKAA